MASIVRLRDRKTGKPNGFRAIQFVDRQGRRPTVYLGKISAKGAESVKVHVEALISHTLSGAQVGDQTLQWLTTISDDLKTSLVKVGLLGECEVSTLGAFLRSYIDERKDLKPSTIITMENVRRNLIAHFGENKRLSDITPGDADAFRRFLETDEELCENTICRRCGIAKQFFRNAQRRRLIAESPFADMKKTVAGANKERDFFITREAAEKVLDACPNNEWRLMFALSRFGGLRCPSEHLALRWGDIDWENNRMLVRSSKTERHTGKATRLVPLFPEIKPFLERAYHEAEDGAEFVIARCRDAKVNLRTFLTKIIERAGLPVWAKLWHNLRGTRQTELAQTYPIHVVCQWLGNTQLIAERHYLRTTEDDFERAVKPQNPTENCAANYNAPSMQNAMQQPATVNSANSQESESGLENSDNCELPKKKGDKRQTLLIPLVGGTELESVTSTMSTLRSNQLS